MKDGVGDVDSLERGSGARYNSGKPPLDFIPVSQVLEALKEMLPPCLEESLIQLARFQEGDDYAINDAIRDVEEFLPSAAYALEYGASKYNKWNWATGMPWSVPLGCALRHVREIAHYELLHPDDESGVPLIGHYLANLIMLSHFSIYYKEGDDRPPKSCFEISEDNAEIFTQVHHWHADGSVEVTASSEDEPIEGHAYDLGCEHAPAHPRGCACPVCELPSHGYHTRVYEDTDIHGKWYRNDLGELVLEGREGCFCRGRGWFSLDMEGSAFESCKDCDNHVNYPSGLVGRKGTDG